MTEIISREINEINDKQKRLFLGCQYARLSIGLDVVNKELKENEPISLNGTETFFVQTKTAAKNAIKNAAREGLLKQKATIEKQLAEFSQRHSYSEFASGYDELEKLASDVYKSDKYDLAKMVFSATLVFDGEYKYQYHTVGLRNISRVLWGDESKLLNIEESIRNIYKDLTKQPFNTTQKVVLGAAVGLAIVTAVSPLLLPIGAGAAPEITGGLAALGTEIGIGGTMLEGISLLALAETALDIIAVGCVYGGMKAYNKISAQKTFREIKWNDAAHILAIKCYLVRSSKYTMPEELYKESINEMLQIIQDLKADTDYVLLVEKENIENNKNKIQVFHNLDKKLMDILVNDDNDCNVFTEALRKRREALKETLIDDNDVDEMYKAYKETRDRQRREALAKAVASKQDVDEMYKAYKAQCDRNRREKAKEALASKQ